MLWGKNKVRFIKICWPIFVLALIQILEETAELIGVKIRLKKSSDSDQYLQGSPVPIFISYIAWHFLLSSRLPFITCNSEKNIHSII
jgi:hypothetical protein